ncbi:MAG: DnaJ domain-containing protein [Gammaproteobacteria bacterium]|nr:DnaJ domain-containing protein [Gammaproteobacteria bacterium]
MPSELFQNYWFGKAIGFTGAFVLAPDNVTILYAYIIAGVCVGHTFDLWASWVFKNTQTRVRPASYSAQASVLASSAYGTFLFAAMGHLAKATGAVSTQHIRYVETLMDHLKLASDDRKQAIELFNAGKHSAYPFIKLSKKCLAKSQPEQQFARLILQSLCDIVVMAPTDQALIRLKSLALLLKFSPTQVGTAFGDAQQAQAKPKSKSPPKPAASHEPATQQSIPATPLDKAYQCLDVPSGSSKSVVKKAYRRLVSRYHPDRLPANASRKQTEYATVKMVEVRDALETILTS